MITVWMLLAFVGGLLLGGSVLSLASDGDGKGPFDRRVWLSYAGFALSLFAVVMSG